MIPFIVTISIIFLIFDLNGIYIGYYFSLGTWGSIIQATTPLPVGLLIIFAFCGIGNCLPFPTPFAFVVIPVAAAYWPLWYLIGLVASAGMTISSIGGYLLGRSGREMLKEKNVEQIESMGQLARERPYFIITLLFVLGMTPLNDDLLSVPLGLSGFSMTKTVIPQCLGKLAMMMGLSFITAIGVFIPWGAIPVVGPVLQLLFGLSGSEPGPFAWVQIIFIFIFVSGMIFFMLRMDFKRFLKDKYGIKKMEK